jgi:membrane protein DedA with SNARE-associated domain
MYASFFILLDSPQFSPFIQHFGYIGIYLWFISFDQITPFPEEISLLIVGYLSALGVFNPVLAGACSLLGFFTIDSIYFFLAKKGSSWIKKKTKGLSKLMQRYRNKIKQHSLKAFFILCFIPRMRLFAPVLAGSSDYSYKRFFLLDASALIVFTALYTSLGLIFYKSLRRLISKVNGLQNIIFFGGITMVAIVIIVLVIRRKKKAGKDD